MTGGPARWFDGGRTRNGTGTDPFEVPVDPALAPTPTNPPGALADVRRLLPGMRVLLGIFGLLTALAVGALYVLAPATDRTFAWTIQPPLTAAFLGAGYAAGFVLVTLSLRDPVWAHSRLAVLTIFVFVVLTSTATLLHLDRLHNAPEFAGSDVLARAAAWFWLTVYVVVPVAMLVMLVLQERVPGRDPLPRHPVPTGLRVPLAGESVVLFAVGVPLFLRPATATALWPWALTPFTAQVVGAWLVAFALATALAAMSGDLHQLRSAAVAYTVFGALVLLAVARFHATLDWARPSSWIFLICALAVVATGAAGWRAAPRVRSDG